MLKLMTLAILLNAQFIFAQTNIEFSPDAVAVLGWGDSNESCWDDCRSQGRPKQICEFECGGANTDDCWDRCRAGGGTSCDLQCGKDDPDTHEGCFKDCMKEWGETPYSCERRCYR